MTLTLDATVMGVAANSYLAVTDATDVLAQYLDHGAWTDASVANQTAALISATTRLEMENYRGFPTTTTQALKWPRNGLYKEYWGTALSMNLIPVPVQFATAALALDMLQQLAAGTISTGGTATDPVVRDFRIGPLAVGFQAPFVYPTAGTDRLPIGVMRLLAPFIVSGVGQYALVRG